MAASTLLFPLGFLFAMFLVHRVWSISASKTEEELLSFPMWESCHSYRILSTPSALWTDSRHFSNQFAKSGKFSEPVYSDNAISGPTNHQIKARANIQGAIIQCSNRRHDSEALLIEARRLSLLNRRRVIGFILGLSCLTRVPHGANAAGLPPEEKPKLCDDACEKELENVPMVTTESGLQYKDIKVGQGPSPPIGFQVAAHYVAMVPSGQIFDSSLEKGQPYIFRVGSGQVIKGLDEGILTMKVGGLRRLYIPGPLAFPKGLPSAPGRPRVAPNSPVIFDVNLLYIPGLETEEE